MPSRRRFLAAAGSASLAGAAGCSSLSLGGESVPLGDDYPDSRDLPGSTAWASFRGNGANTACAPDADPIENPSVEWESPEFATEHRIQWRTVTVNGATAFAGGDSLHAVDVLSGEPVWTNEDVFATRVAPDVSDGVAWTRTGADTSTVAGIDTASGEVSARRDLGAELFREPSVTTRTPYVVVPTADGVAGVVARSGDSEAWQDSRWHHDLFAEGSFRPATTRTVAVVSYTGEVYRFGSSGTPVWRANLHRRPRAQPVVGADRIYVATRGGAVALDRETGAREWEYTGVDTDETAEAEPGEVSGVQRAAVAFDGQRLVLATENALHAVSAKTGERRWTYEVENELTGLPAIGGDRVYVAAQTDVHALSVDGTHQWTFDAADPVGATLAVTDGRLVTIRNAGLSEGVRVVALA
jgi:outer membrane protein assembly factor BamB